MKLFNLSTLTGKLVLLATILASGMGFLDGSVVNIAIPSLQKSLHANIPDIQWIVNSYVLMLATLILISGSLGDKFGVKRIFSLGIIIFTVSSFLCGISSSILQLTIFRTLQGIGASMMVPGSLSIIITLFDEKEHGKVIGLWSGVSGGVAALGPLLGGFLVQAFGWSAIFFINIPLGILALFITLKYVPLTKFEGRFKIDFLGALLIFLAFLGISFGLIEQPLLGWSSIFVYLSILLGILFLIAFIFWERKVKKPLIPFEIFRNPLVVGANIATLFLYGALSAVLFFVVLNLQQVQHLSPIFAGASLLPTILIITFLSGPAGSLADKIGPRIPMIVGPTVVALGMASFAFSGTNANYFISFLPGLILFGLGMAFVIAPLTKSALSVDKKFSGSASGVNNSVSRMAGLLTVALLGVVVITGFSSKLSASMQKTVLTNTQKQQIMVQKDDLAGISMPQNFSVIQKEQAQTAIENSFVYGFRIAMGICAFLALLSAIVSYYTIQNPKKN